MRRKCRFWSPRWSGWIVFCALAAPMQAQTRLAEPPRQGAKTDDRIAALTKQQAARPSFHTECLLAKAYIQKMRETVDFGYIERASKLVEDVLARDSGNFEAIRLRSEIGMERHEFRQVAEYSREMTKLAPDDPGSWGSLGDAEMELGRYDAAREAYSKMVSLRPGLSSYNRMAWYQFVTGQADAAIELMRSAIAGGSEAPENTAWCLSDLGRMYFKAGRLAEAEAAFRQALKEFPGYYPAFAGLGSVAAAQHKDAIAIEDFQRAQAAVPLPDYAAALAALYQRAGKTAEAGKQVSLIDVIDQMARAANEKTNRNLAVLYADQGRRLERALELVQNEIAVRPDVYTYDALGWVLFKLGRFAEAGEASEKAVALNTPEPAFYYHAGMIANALGQKEPARGLLKRALELNAEFDIAEARKAREFLLSLEK